MVATDFAIRIRLWNTFVGEDVNTYRSSWLGGTLVGTLHTGGTRHSASLAGWEAAGSCDPEDGVAGLSRGWLGEASVGS